MLKKVITGYILIISLLLCSFTAPVLAATATAAASSQDDYNSTEVIKILDKTSVFELKAKASVLVDGTSGKVLIEKNSHEKLPIASVTKVMSMLVIMEAVDSGKIKLDDKVTVSEHSYNMGGSQVYLKPGEEFTVNEMLKAVAIHSANDATVAMAEMVAGSEDAFVVMMNEKAKALGMNDTNFLDCTGLTDEGHYSSAYDVALMSRELIIKHPKILDYTTTWHDTFRDGQFSLDNTNKLIRYYDGANGLKTGFTTKAGYCLSAAAKKNNLQLIAVVLGEADTNTRFAEAKKLLDHGFANYEVSQINKKGEEVGSIEVKKGLNVKVKAVYPDDVKLLLNKGEKGKITREVKLEPSITAPVKAGQKVGTVIFKVNETEVGSTDVVSDTGVDKASFMRLFFRMVLGWFGIGR